MQILFFIVYSLIVCLFCYGFFAVPPPHPGGRVIIITTTIITIIITIDNHPPILRSLRTQHCQHLEDTLHHVFKRRHRVRRASALHLPDLLQHKPRHTLGQAHRPLRRAPPNQRVVALVSKFRRDLCRYEIRLSRDTLAPSQIAVPGLQRLCLHPCHHDLHTTITTILLVRPLLVGMVLWFSYIHNSLPCLLDARPRLQRAVGVSAGSDWILWTGMGQLPLLLLRV